jgi:hypothetical protein
MLRLIAVAGFALFVATSAQAMTPAPPPQLDEMVTRVAEPSAGVCDGRAALAHYTSERTGLVFGLALV